MKAKAHFITPTFVLHIDKHNLPVTFCPQSASSFPPSPPSVGLPSLWPPPVPAPTSKQCVFFPHSRRIQRIHSLCHVLFMHYTSFLNNLSSHLSIFPPLPPSVSASLSSASLKAFHLSTISMPGHASPIRLNSYLPLYIPSSLLFLSFFSIFLPSYLSHPSSLCPLPPLRPPAHPPS